MDIKVRNKRLAKDIQKGIHKSHKATRKKRQLLELSENQQ